MKNQVAIVTGGTSGIGEDIVRAICEKGVKVIVSGRNQERGQALIDSISSECYFIAGDISDPEINDRLVTEAIIRFGRLDMVIMSAGTLGIGRLEDLDLDDWRKTIDTNLNAVFYLMKYAISELQKNNGRVVIIGSVAALHAFPNHPAYTASKGALIPFVKQMALEYGPEIRINMVSPAQVKTPLLENSVSAFEHPESILEETAAKLPMKRLGVPTDISNAVLFLLSDNASWITGTNIVVDGGFLST